MSSEIPNSSYSSWSTDKHIPLTISNEKKVYRYITRIDDIPQIPSDERETLRQVSEQFAFRCNEYYLSLINWNNPKDPIRRIVLPHPDELEDWGRLDASNEHKYTVGTGFQHKYRPTVVLLLNDVCGGYCRFCFRKRLFMNMDEETVRDIREGLQYIWEHDEISNVLLTGGDPLVMSTRRLAEIIYKIREIPHVRVIRIGTKIPAYNPYRILDDPLLIDLIEDSIPEKKIYFMCQFNHPKELTKDAREAMLMVQKAGARTFNQTPLIRGVNDNPKVLSKLFKDLSFVGISPYYVFQCRPTLGNKIYAVPIEKGYDIFQKAREFRSGLSKSARYVMSHVTGKIAVVGMTDDNIFLRYHQPADPKDHGKFMVFKRNPDAYWFDDYKEVEPKYYNPDFYDE